MESVALRYPTIDVPKETLVYLFAAHDRAVDVLRLSVSLLRYCIDPTSDIRVPSLRPISPLDSSIPSLLEEQATHVDVEQWVADAFVWGRMTGEHVYSAADVEAARERYPRLFATMTEAVGRQMAVFLILAR
jgi:hypothetical protein